LEEKQQNEDEAKKQETAEENCKKTEANMFQKVKARFSTRSKKLKKDVNQEITNEKVKNEKQSEEESDQSNKDVQLKNDTNVNEKETSKSINEEKKEEREENDDEKKEKSLDDKNNPKKEANMFARVKERLSKRSKKPKTEKENKQHEKELDKTTGKENENKNETKPGSKDESDETIDASMTKKESKEENIFQKLLKRISFRSKKKKETEGPVKDANIQHDQEDKKEDDTNEDDTKSLSSVDEELSALCKDNTDETQGTSPSVPIVNSSRPPLPSIRRPPSSATTAQSRPVSQLDAALKQFRLSTAASRENLRSSKVDISQVEEQVKTMVTSRPSTPTPAGWRSRAPAENKNLTDQWAKLSSSMTDLR